MPLELSEMEYGTWEVRSPAWGSSLELTYWKVWNSSSGVTISSSASNRKRSQRVLLWAATAPPPQSNLFEMFTWGGCWWRYTSSHYNNYSVSKSMQQHNGITSIELQSSEPTANQEIYEGFFKFTAKKFIDKSYWTQLILFTYYSLPWFSRMLLCLQIAKLAF